MAAKAFVAETQAARARGELISRKLVEFQASYLLVAMRQRILALPQAYAGRLVGLTDPHEVSQILRAAMIELLDELKDLPSRATDANWLERVAEEQAAGGAEPVAKAGKRGPQAAPPAGDKAGAEESLNFPPVGSLKRSNSRSLSRCRRRRVAVFSTFPVMGFSSALDPFG